MIYDKKSTFLDSGMWLKTQHLQMFWIQVGFMLIYLPGD